MHWKDGAKFFSLCDNEIPKNNLWNEEDVYFLIYPKSNIYKTSVQKFRT